MNSILNQTYQDYEIILLDDCSCDDSRGILEKYKGHNKVSHIVFNDVNSGSPFSQWKKGLELAKGEWIWIAESDDVADEQFLEYLIGAVYNRSNIGLAYSHLRWIDSKSNLMFSQEESDEYVYYSGQEFIISKLLYSTTIFNVSSAVFRKDVLLSVDWSKFEKMKMCGDYYLYTLISSICDVCECKKILDSYRMHNSNTSGELTKQGWSFIESMPIFNHIIKGYKIRPHLYALHYARMWAKNGFSSNVNMRVSKAFISNGYLSIPIMFLIFKLRYLLKSIK